MFCPLDRIDRVITDEGISDQAATMLESAGVTRIVDGSGAGQRAKKGGLVALQRRDWRDCALNGCDLVRPTAHPQRTCGG